MNNKEQYDLIEGYLKGTLDEQTMAACTNRLQNDVAFQEQMMYQKAADTIIIGNRLAEIKKMMDEDFTSSDKNKNRLRWGLCGLLCTSVLLGVWLYTSVYTKRNIHAASVTNDFTHAVPLHTDKNNRQEEMQKIHSPKRVVTDTILSAYPEISNNQIEKNTFTPDTLTVKNSSILSHNEKPRDTNHIGNACMDIHIEGTITTEPACKNQTDGALRIRESSLIGGKSPYSYLLIQEGNDTIRQPKASFNNLAAGMYTLYFIDSRGCSDRYKNSIYINERICEVKQAQSFSPHNGERFAFPVSSETEATASVYSKTGQLVYHGQISTGAYWDGTNLNGQIPVAGMYIYIIEYVSGTKETGEVIIY